MGVGERTSSLAMARIKFVSLIYAGVVASQSVLDRACNYVTDCKAFNAQCDCAPDMDLFNAVDRSPAGPWCKDKAESKCKCKTGFQEYTYAEPKAFTIGEKTETFAVGCEDPNYALFLHQNVELILPALKKMTREKLNVNVRKDMNKQQITKVTFQTQNARKLMSAKITTAHQ